MLKTLKTVSFLFFGACYLPLAVLYADVHVSTSTDEGAVQYAINAASHGDTVTIPAGTAKWFRGVNIYNKGITLQGAGMDPATGTVIIDSTTGGNLSYQNKNPINIQNTTDNFVRVTGLVIDGTDIPNAGSQAGIYLIGDTKFFRIDHIFFKQLAKGVGSGGYVEGLVDHCTFYLYPDAGKTPITGIPGTQWMVSPFPTSISNTYPESAKMDVDWQRPLSLGTSNAAYVEDCHYNWSAEWISASILGGDGGNRIVFRYNTSSPGPVNALENYGVVGSATRGIASIELYKNRYHFTGSGYMFRFGSGTGIIYDNEFTGNLSYGANNFFAQNYRAENPDNGVHKFYWGLCNGTNPLDGNEAADATATGAHSGSDDSNVLVCAG
ncbi:MAG: hypothetical protein A2297_00210 [Elusimicrobia bacterium RIFOXYB2_FULL_48_7]|nr:MAG: hypothetical protein A2297_00210 [Elusimicrobia bacterium RIFOXYB2_FULL_48_7]